MGFQNFNKINKAPLNFISRFSMQNKLTVLTATVFIDSYLGNLLQIKYNKQKKIYAKLHSVLSSRVILLWFIYRFMPFLFRYTCKNCFDHWLHFKIL